MRNSSGALRSERQNWTMPRSNSYETHGLCTPPRPATGSSRCFHASRGDSVHATLRKPALSFCSRCEALAASRPPHSQRCPPTTAAASASNMARRGAKAVKEHTVASTFDNDKSVYTSTWVKEARVATHPLIGRSCRTGPCRGPAIIPEGLS
jgi:hypothetical protein